MYAYGPGWCWIVTVGRLTLGNRRSLARSGQDDLYRPDKVVSEISVVNLEAGFKSSSTLTFQFLRKNDTL